MITEALISHEIAVPHGFFTRRGGVSQGPFASLNCSLSGADDRAAVLENRSRIAHSLGVSPENLVGLSQVHSADVVVVDVPWAVGWGPRADALVTTLPGVALGVITADCAPVLFADARAGVIGAAHAGWRGAADGVLEATITAMRKLGATDISAVVGPCIHQPSYEVAADMRDAVLAADSSAAPFFADGANADHWQFDLPGYCAARLRAGGAASVGIIDADTLVDADRFYSHRRRTLAGGGSIGHQMSAIVL
jgi:YfiH family protein